METKINPVEKIAEVVKKSKRVAITSHLRPDGDSICTSLALAMMVEDLGHEARIFNKDKTPFPFTNIPDIDRITIGQIPPEGFDLVILLECASVSRSGQLNIEDYFKINIDHHHSNDYYADINWVDPYRSAVAELVYVLGEKIGITFSPEIAGHLYCAIVSDTGSFQFSNTNERSFEVCHNLVKYGASPIKTSELLFNNNSPEKIKLLGQVLSTLTINDKGNIASIVMFKRTLESFNLKEIDTEDITTLARSIKGIDLVLFFKEMQKDTFRVSLRSKGSTCSACIAEHFGGGGHMNAAGFTARGKYEDLIKKVPAEIEELLKKPLHLNSALE